MSPDNVRQLYRRAQQRVGAEAAHRVAPDPARARALADRFLAAAATGEVAPLAELLAEDVVVVGDGGGKASSILRPFSGRLRAARFFRGLARKATPDMTFSVVRANGAPALLVRAPGEVLGLYVLDVDPQSGLVRAIHAVRNPDKLRRLAA
jgi:RNA polymerase sigma-70 factor (ECF subfamily)